MSSKYPQEGRVQQWNGSRWFRLVKTFDGLKSLVHCTLLSLLAERKKTLKMMLSFKVGGKYYLPSYKTFSSSEYFKVSVGMSGDTLPLHALPFIEPLQFL